MSKQEVYNQPATLEAAIRLIGTKRYLNAIEVHGKDAVHASIEEWRIGNSETPFRLAAEFKRQFAKEKN